MTRLTFAFPTEVVKEGKVSVLVPKLDAFVTKAEIYAPSKAPVFYNPAMELNRDLAVLVLQTYQRIIKKELSICEPLAGCGIRGIRFVIDVEGIRNVVINDINIEAARIAKFNVELNDASGRVKVTNDDANFLLSKYAGPHKRFDYIDIDPFGSPAPYLDSAIRALKKGGLLALTATDMAPLCGVHWKACLRKYGGKPLRTEYCHELAVRLMLGCLVMAAAKHDVGIRVVFSYSDYNYGRTYALLDYGATHADNSIQMLGYIFHCFECFHRETFQGILFTSKKECPECGSKLSLAGPLWLGNLWDEQFSIQMRKEVENRNLRLSKKILKMLSLIIEESKAPATYYVIDKICDKFNLPTQSLSKVINELRKDDFQAAGTHFNTKAIRTNASAKVVKEAIIRVSTYRKLINNLS
jgi:tRNA (guanine26-N2/guanine27-N2)-dimethyltransferase